MVGSAKQADKKLLTIIPFHLKKKNVLLKHLQTYKTETR